MECPLDLSVCQAVVPGDRLGHERHFAAGSGTYVSFGFIYSALVGYKLVESCERSPAKPVVQVIGLTVSSPGPSSPEARYSHQNDVHRLLAIGDKIWGRVTRVGTKKVDVDILMKDASAKTFRAPYKGRIKAGDVRTYDLDRLKLMECFRPGDIIQARIISTGDSRGSFLLSTLPIGCGVVLAQSVFGGKLEPVAAQFMRCDKTGRLEHRKVAKPVKL